MGKVRIVVSVDWEGLSLRSENLEAIIRLRDELPDVPLTHFMNAAYYTQPGANTSEANRKIRSALRPGDEIGLHIHCWKSLVDAAGVSFRAEPTFWGRPTRPNGVGKELGYDVEIEAYEVFEIRGIVRTAQRILMEAGFSISASFRAGGWAAGPRTLEALRAEGILVDSSAVDADWHDEWGDLPLRSRLRELWPDITPQSEPYEIRTAAGPMLEMPDTGALADYLTGEEMKRHVEQALKRLAQAPARDVFIHLGFHQDSARRFSGRVSEALRSFQGHSRIIFETLEASARVAREGIL